MLLPELLATAPEADFALTSPGILPALRPDNAEAAESLVRAVLGTDEAGTTAPFGTDAARFQDVGMSAVVCGPGDIAVAHRPNEWIARAQLAAGRRFVGDLAATLSRH